MSRPLVLGCRSGSPLSRLVGELIDDLAAAGAVERADDPAAVDPARRLVVVDGCPSACMSRLLAAEGREVAATVNLSALDAPVDDREALAGSLLGELRRGGAVRPPSRPRRSVRPAEVPAHRGRGEQEYLLALDALTSPAVDCGAIAPEAPVLAAHVAAELGLSRPAVGEMLERLREEGLVRRGRRKEIFLTEQGREAADEIVRRQRLLECFVTATLGYPVEEAYERAADLRNAFTPADADRLAAALGEPERCPHGWPIDAAAARAESGELVSAASLPPGAAATVVRVPERGEAGIEPGARVVGGTGYATGVFVLPPS